MGTSFDREHHRRTLFVGTPQAHHRWSLSPQRQPSLSPQWQLLTFLPATTNHISDVITTGRTTSVSSTHRHRPIEPLITVSQTLLFTF